MNAKNIRFVRHYLNILLFLMVVQVPMVLLGTFLDIRSVFISAFLIMYLFLDLLIIVINKSSFRLNKFEVSLIVLLLVGIPIGLFNNLDYSRRHLTDFLMPLVFVLKIAIYRIYFSKQLNREYFNMRFLKKLVIGTILSAIVAIGLFYILATMRPMYLGMTPVIYPSAIYSLLNYKYVLTLVSLAIVFLSGKRAILLGIVALYSFYYLVIKKKMIKFIIVLFFMVGLIVSIFPFTNIAESRAFNKYKWTLDQIPELTQSPEILDILTGGRIGEIKSITSVMNNYDYIFGKGIGFTYALESTGYHYVERHSNAHFTPLSVISKYGFLFYFILSIYVIKSLLSGIRWRRLESKKLATFFVLFVVAINIDFLFSYGIFTDKIYPVALGFLNVKKIQS